MSDQPQSANDVFDHPRLGRFRRGVLGWGKRINVPQFDDFCWSTKYPEADNPKGRYSLGISGERSDDLPTPAGFEILERVLTDPGRIVGLVIDSLWDDFQGRGPDSGMWWHNNLAGVAKAAETDFPALRAPQDLLPLIRMEGLCLVYHCYWPELKPIIDLMFWAAFEEEHGLGVLTDGDRVVGIGYSIDVTPFNT